MSLYIARWLHPSYGEHYEAASAKAAAIRHAETLGCSSVVITVTPVAGIEGLGFIALRDRFTRWRVTRIGEQYAAEPAARKAWPRNVKP